MNKVSIDFILRISAFMQRFGFLPPVADWIGCQFAMESNFGKSRFAKVKNNLCGMKVPRLRPNLNVNLGTGFASYLTTEDSCLDYVLLLCYNHFTYTELSNLDCFLNRLRAVHYCDDEGYFDAINNLYKQFNSQKND